MPITVEDIRGIAQLARLSLTKEEEIHYAEQLSAVLSYVDMLNEVDTDSVTETTQVKGLEDVLRDDVAVAVDDETRAKLVALFPKSEKGMLVVPGVFEDQ